ncbi:hypothetical protein [Actinacidiphila glaucinigra]|uniref:hypothetical protein n=1 Tax=Actinacidiphila glaucinigra TaxID=235986 RepID=UPI002E3095ED|nr:hypothetical protein [Actinacidiphila glaucinigra]
MRNGFVDLDRVARAEFGHGGATQVYLAGGQGLGLDEGLQAADVDRWLELLGEVIEEAGRLGVRAP